MKTVQKFWVLSLFMAAGLMLSGCGDTASNSGSGTSTESSEGSGSTEESSEGSATNASATKPTGEYQVVSLDVPNMS